MYILQLNLSGKSSYNVVKWSVVYGYIADIFTLQITGLDKTAKEFSVKNRSHCVGYVSSCGSTPKGKISHIYEKLEYLNK